MTKAWLNQLMRQQKRLLDETKHAQALLDIIKEIDYFANPQHTAS